MIGTEVSIGRMLRLPDGTTSVIAQGERRVSLLDVLQIEPHIRARVAPISETTEKKLPTEALMRAVLALFEKIVHLSPGIPDDAYVAAMNADLPGWLADLVASTLNLELPKRQELLETLDPTTRLEKISILLAKELDVLELQNKIHSQVQDEVDKSQREYYLREQMRAIQHELGK
jgi:ATP-dependent Lon protease